MTQNDPYIGKYFHEYRIDRLIGQGNMASVYLATDFRLQRQAAIKVNNKDFRNNPDYVVRILREAQTMAQMDHPHIVQAFRMGELNDILYLAMQYIEGADLSIVLQSYREDGEYIETPEAVRIIREMGSALDYAHKEGIIHRDIKPSNIMLNSKGKSYLTDFGLVLVEMEGTQGDVLGTPYYLAPEQAIASSDALPQSDLYALGVIMYEMFTNRRPFEAKKPLALAMMHVTMPPRPPHTFRPEISPQVEAVIMKALAKKPQDRYQTGAELADALAEAVRVGGIGEPVPLDQASDQPSTILSRTLTFSIPEELQEEMEAAMAEDGSADENPVDTLILDDAFLEDRLKALSGSAPNKSEQDETMQDPAAVDLRTTQDDPTATTEAEPVAADAASVAADAASVTADAASVAADTASVAADAASVTADAVSVAADTASVAVEAEATPSLAEKIAAHTTEATANTPQPAAGDTGAAPSADAEPVAAHNDSDSDAAPNESLVNPASPPDIGLSDTWTFWSFPRS